MYFPLLGLTASDRDWPCLCGWPCLWLTMADRVCVCLTVTDRVSVSVCRAQLQKEKKLREDAEKQRQELEERLKKYQDEVERARKGQGQGHSVTQWWCSQTPTTVNFSLVWKRMGQESNSLSGFLCQWSSTIIVALFLLDFSLINRQYCKNNLTGVIKFTTHSTQLSF